MRAQLLLLPPLLSLPATGEVVTGTASSADGWAFLGKFNFDVVPRRDHDAHPRWGGHKYACGEQPPDTCPPYCGGNKIEITLRAMLVHVLGNGTSNDTAHAMLHALHLHAPPAGLYLDGDMLEKDGSNASEAAHGAPVDGHAGPWDALQILLYDDQEFSWPAVYDEGLRPDVKCGERDMVHSYHPQHGGHIDGHVPCDGSIPVRWQRGGPNAEAHWLHSLGEGEGYESWYEFTFVRAIEQHLRPRTWYVALDHRDCHGFAHIKYEIKFLNPGPSEFGTDEQGLRPLYILCSLLFGALLWAQMRSRQLFASQYLAGRLPRLLQLCLTFATAGSVLLSCHYLVFGWDGVGMPFFRFLGSVCLATSKLVLVLVRFPVCFSAFAPFY